MPTEFVTVSATFEIARESPLIENGNVSDVVARHEDDIAKTEVYMCGPPPMVDAALELLETHAVPKDQVFYDKFTSPIFD